MRATPFAVALLLGALPLAGCVSSGQDKVNAPPQTREFQLFTTSLDFNETQVGIPHDTFTPDHLIVNKGDTVVIHFHNLEDTDEHHTFTMQAPYAMDYDVAPGAEANITFVADHAGVFPYTCGFHQPTMTGYLVVIG